MGSNERWKRLAGYTQVGSHHLCKSTCDKNTVSLLFGGGLGGRDEGESGKDRGNNESTCRTKGRI